MLSVDSANVTSELEPCSKSYHSGDCYTCEVEPYQVCWLSLPRERLAQHCISTFCNVKFEIIVPGNP